MDWKQSGGSVSSLAKTFTDTFHRANVANLGPNWIYSSQPTALTQAHTTQYSVSGNTWTAQDSSANQTQNNSPECWIPFAIMNTAVAGKTQHAQARFLANSSAAGHDMRAGVMAMCGINAAGDWQMYLFWQELGPAYRIFKYAANTLTDIGAGSIGVPVANDIMRLSVVVGASNTINCIVNGVTIKTVIDGSPIITGWPGMTRSIWISGGAPPLTTCSFDNGTWGLGA